MGILDFLSGKIRCPACGSEGARKSRERPARCPNPSCLYFDSTLPKPSAGRGSFSRPVVIHYVNFENEAKTFTADADSLVRRNNHILVRVAPKRRQIALSRDRIQNLSEVENLMRETGRSHGPTPTARERQVLAYHKKYKSTSPLYEKIRAKYPDW